MPEWDDTQRRERNRRESRDREFEREPERGSDAQGYGAERSSEFEREGSGQRWSARFSGQQNAGGAGQGWGGGQGDWGTRREDAMSQGPGRQYDRDFTQTSRSARGGEDWSMATPFDPITGRNNYARGGSGSDAGWQQEQSYGSQRDLSSRGGGAGIRETENWAGNAGQRYGQGHRGYENAAGGQTGNWGGGLAGYGQQSNRGSAGSENSQPGRFTGRGPKGWTRSDERIREDLCERLTAHPDVDASEIDIQVSNAEVTLAGTVDERQAKRLAEDIAEAISGVREVHNNIRVNRGSWFGSSDKKDNDPSLAKQRTDVEASTGNNLETPLGLKNKT
jgi:osmotically-inducible protein OsmY